PGRERLPGVALEVIGGDAVGGVDVTPDFVSENSILEEKKAIPVETVPLLAGEARRRLLVRLGLCLGSICDCGRHGHPPYCTLGPGESDLLRVAGSPNTQALTAAPASMVRKGQGSAERVLSLPRMVGALLGQASGTSFPSSWVRPQTYY